MKHVTVTLRIALEEGESLDISKAVDCGDAEMIRTTQQYRIVRNWPLGSGDPNEFVVVKSLPNSNEKSATAILNQYRKFFEFPETVRLEVREVSKWEEAT